METATDPDGNLVNYLQVSDDYEDSLDEFGDNKTDQGKSAWESGFSHLIIQAGSGSSTPTEEYTSQIPADLLALATNISDDEQGQKIASEWEQRQPQPPSLPPHLETVLLNSQAISEEDNSVLPEPNHVTLNHLYASSIKDNVMALSTTTRYRKKVGIWNGSLKDVYWQDVIVCHDHVLSSSVSQEVESSCWINTLVIIYREQYIQCFRMKGLLYHESVINSVMTIASKDLGG